MHAKTILNDCYLFASSRRVQCSWTCIAVSGVPPSPRESCAAIALGNSVLFFGGRSRECQNDASVFSLARDTHAKEGGASGGASIGRQSGRWEPCQQVERPSGRHAHGLAPLGGGSTVFVFGGRSCKEDCLAACTAAATGTKCSTAPHSLTAHLWLVASFDRAVRVMTQEQTGLELSISNLLQALQ